MHVWPWNSPKYWFDARKKLHQIGKFTNLDYINKDEQLQLKTLIQPEETGREINKNMGDNTTDIYRTLHTTIEYTIS